MWPVPLPGLLADVYPEVRLLGWSCVLVTVLAGGVYVALRARQWYQQPEIDATPEPTLEDYRKLLDEGLLDPAEFERIRARLEQPPADAIQDQSLRGAVQDPSPAQPPRDPPGRPVES